MAVSLVGHGAQLETTVSGNNGLVPYPASGIQDGDMALLYGTQNNLALPRLGSLSAAPLTDLVRHSCTGDTAVPNLYFGWRRCDGSENGTNFQWFCYNNNTIAKILVFRGVDLDNILVGALADIAVNVDTTMPGVTMPSAGGALVYGTGKNSSAVTFTPATFAGGTFTEVADRTTGSRSGAAGYFLNPAAGDTGDVTTRATGNARSIGNLIGLVPAAPAASGKFFQFL